MNKKNTFLLSLLLLFSQSCSCMGVEAPKLMIRDTESEISRSVKNRYIVEGFLILVPFGLAGGVWIYSLRRQVASRTADLRRELIHSEQAEKEVARLNDELRRSRKEIAFTLGEVIETRSRETANHVRRVAAFTERLSSLAGLEFDEARLISLASSMHDIGKIGISDVILNKPGRLSSFEFELMKAHTTIGHEILSRAGGELFDTAALIALQHHEWWNGSGYPQGLRGEAISLEGRIVAIADVFDALSHSRVYKEAWPVHRVVNVMVEERGSHFDPELLDLFLDNIDEFIRISESLPDDMNEVKQAC